MTTTAAPKCEITLEITSGSRFPYLPVCSVHGDTLLPHKTLTEAIDEGDRHVTKIAEGLASGLYRPSTTHPRPPMRHQRWSAC